MMSQKLLFLSSALVCSAAAHFVDFPISMKTSNSLLSNIRKLQEEEEKAEDVETAEPMPL